MPFPAPGVYLLSLASLGSEIRPSDICLRLPTAFFPLRLCVYITSMFSYKDVHYWTWGPP